MDCEDMSLHNAIAALTEDICCHEHRVTSLRKQVKTALEASRIKSQQLKVENHMRLRAEKGESRALNMLEDTMEELSRSVAQTKAGRSRESALKTQILVKDMKIEELEEQVNLLRTQLDTVNQALSAATKSASEATLVAARHADNLTKARSRLFFA